MYALVYSQKEVSPDSLCCLPVLKTQMFWRGRHFVLLPVREVNDAASPHLEIFRTPILVTSQHHIIHRILFSLINILLNGSLLNNCIQHNVSFIPFWTSSHKKKDKFNPNQNISFLIRQNKANKMGTLMFFHCSGNKGYYGLKIYISKEIGTVLRLTANQRGV